MKQLIKGVLATLILAAMFVLPAKAQVSGEFLSVELVKADYVPLAGGTVIQPFEFILPPATPDNDDGYYKIPIGFPFEYNSEVYSELWISVNGFVTFDPPLLQRQENPEGLFINQPSSYQTNVLAPYWGDHVYRTIPDELNGYKRSRISYQSAGGVLTVEWRDLNINDKSLNSSVGSFQLRLYRSDDPMTPQGDVEFAYGQIGGNQNTPNQTVVTKNASVGIKGSFADFLNGLYPCEDGNSCVTPEARTETTLTDEWTPSGATNNRILFTTKKTFNVEEWWGDGDVDFSKAPGQRHFGLPQNRFVTFNDVRIIMRSVADKMPLDSVRRRAAYHGDVDHNGRYFYHTDSTGFHKVRVTRKDLNYWQNLPNEVTSLQQIYFECDEHDAAWIIAYLGARVIQLPWLYDTMTTTGRYNDIDVATGIFMGESELIGNKTLIPIHINGTINGPLSMKFDVTASVSNVFSNVEDNVLNNIEFDNNTVVFATSGNFDSKEAIFYLEVENNTPTVNLEDVRFNGKNIGTVAKVEDLTDARLNVSTSPNPFTENAQISVTVPANGTYRIAIYDVLGNEVKSISNIALYANNINNFDWNGTNNSGNLVNPGMYIVRVEGENTSISTKVLFNR